MKMINKIFIDVLLLSIEGGFISIIFFIVQKKIYQHTSANFTVIINMLSILCFVVPFFKIISYKDYSYNVFYNKDMVISTYGNTVQKMLYTTIKDINLANSITLLWFIGFIVYIILGIISYLYFLINIKNKCSVLTHHLWIDNFIKLSNTDRSNKSIKLMVSNLLFQPCSTGIRTKMIIIPSYLLDSLSNEEIEIILIHELNHIKKRDILSKLFIYFLNSLNWFNPLFYLLRKNLDELLEIRCDEDLNMYKDLKQRKSYINILIKLHEIKFKYTHKENLMHFSTEKNNSLKRRIWCIMKKNNSKKNFLKAIIVGLTVCTITSGTFIAKASDNIINSVFSNHTIILDRDSYYVEESSKLSIDYKFIDFSADNLLKKIQLGETSFYPAHSNIEISYKVILNNNENLNIIENAPSLVKHAHEYEEVNINEHKKLSDGSCTTTIYEGLRCTLCKALFRGDVLSIETSTPCRH